MGELIRFSVSMEEELLAQFDALIKEHGYSNRSEAIRALIRDRLVQEEWKNVRSETVGTITFVYDHHQRELTEKLTASQHKWYRYILSAMHIHLDEDHCLEVLAVRGRADEIRKIADALLSVKGVKHGKLVMTSTGKNL